MHLLPCTAVGQSIALQTDDEKNILSKRIKPLVHSLFRLCFFLFFSSFWFGGASIGNSFDDVSFSCQGDSSHDFDALVDALRPPIVSCVRCIYLFIYLNFMNDIGLKQALHNCPNSIYSVFYIFYEFLLLILSDKFFVCRLQFSSDGFFLGYL